MFILLVVRIKIAVVLFSKANLRLGGLQEASLRHVGSRFSIPNYKYMLNKFHYKYSNKYFNVIKKLCLGL